MPRGRPSLRSSNASTVGNSPSIPAIMAGEAEIDELAANPQLVKSALPETQTRRMSGRLTRASSGTDAAQVSQKLTAAASTLSRSTSRRQSRASAARSESATPAPTLDGTSTDGGYSTPDTSVLTTPAASEVVHGDYIRRPRTSIEVQLPVKPRPTVPAVQGRATRNSIFSMKSSKRRNEIEDSEDEEADDDLKTSNDAKLAHRLQAEEYAAAASQTSQTENAFAALEPRPALKRTRASTTKAAASGDARVIPDSDDAQMDMDEPKATVAAESGADSDMDEPLAKRRTATRQSTQPTRSTIPRRGRKKAVVDAQAQDDYSDDDAPLAFERQFGGTRNKDISKMSVDEYLGLDDLPALIRELDELNGSDESILSTPASGLSSATPSDSDTGAETTTIRRIATQRRQYRVTGNSRRVKKERERLETHHPEITTMWDDLEKMPVLKAGKAPQPQTISRQLKPFQLEGLAWMTAMEKTEWKGGLLGDEMGLGKTIQAVSLIMSDYPAKQPTLVLVPPVALMQWQAEIKSYTDGTLKTFVFHGTNQKAKSMTLKELKKYDVIMMSYNSLESMYRKQEKGFTRKDGIHKEKSLIHAINFHRVLLDEAHCIKTRTTMTAKACFALKTDFRWCLTGTPLQNRIGEFFSLIRFLNIRPFASYLCKQCPCSCLEWTMDEFSRCTSCKHASMQHVSVFNQELLNPIQQYGNLGPGREAFRKLRLMTDRIMLRRLKKDHTNAMELPVKEIYVDRQFFGEEENDFSNSIMTNGQRNFDTYVAQGVLLNNYANIFGLIMQMRQVADHPDLILKKNAEGGQNVLICSICDETAEDAVRSRCKHDFCRACVASYIRSADEPDCPRCHISLSIDLEQPEIEQDENHVKKSSIINRIKMENWTSSSKIELLVHELHKLRSKNATHKSIIFSQFTTMLQLIEWRLRRAGITTVMLDGSMTPAQRQASIEHFMTNIDVECFLVSLKAGGVALNLTEASRVFIVDPWWNPAAEWQSADRCHRIGQTRPCTITRLCIEDSVESRMVLIQEKKTSMIHSTVNADDKAIESLTPEDLQFLFRGS